MRPRSASAVTASMASVSRSLSHAPITPNVSQKMNSMMPRKIGMAVYLPVSTRSMRMLSRLPRLSPFFTTVCAHSLSMNA